MGGRPENTPDVLWNKVDKRGPDECWPWNGFRNKEGYGRTWIKDKGYYAHRVIFDLANPGTISLSAPRNKADPGFIRHRCDNPPCCNPNHLLLGNYQDNADDRVARNRVPRFKSTESPRAKFSDEEVSDIRLQKKGGATIGALALLHDVSRSCISHMLYGRSYQDVS